MATPCSVHQSTKVCDIDSDTDIAWTDEISNPIMKERRAARLFFVKSNDTYPNGVQHILRETRAQRRVKVGTDLGEPIFRDMP
jgi:hypothetical protein